MKLTFKEQFNKKYNQPLDKSNSLETISKLTGIKKSILLEVFRRGSGAWEGNVKSVRLKDGSKSKTAPRSARMGKQQWSYARVYGFVMKNPKQVGKGKPDSDLYGLLN